MPDKNKEAFSNNDTDSIKLIAAVAMFFDHLGKIFFPEIMAFQIFGRIAFPIFAYCLAVGAFYTKDIKKYMLRLLTLALISQPIYVQAFVPGCADPQVYLQYKNVLFSLFIGLIGIYGVKQKKPFIFAVSVMTAAFGGLDYGLYGFLMMLCFYIFRNNSLLSVAVITTLIGTRFFAGTKIDIYGITIGKNFFGLLSLPLIYCKTNLNIKTGRYFFYIFYPAHLLVLYLLHYIL